RVPGASALALPDALPICGGLDRLQVLHERALLGIGQICAVDVAAVAVASLRRVVQPAAVFRHAPPLEVDRARNLDAVRFVRRAADRKSTRLNSSHVKISY